MTALSDLDDLAITTIGLDEGIFLLASWDPHAGPSGMWVARESLPAGAVSVSLDPQPNRLVPSGLYEPTMDLQALIDQLFDRGFATTRLVTDESTGQPTFCRSLLITDYRRLLGPTELGSNGALNGISYGRPDRPAGGFANASTILVEVQGSEEPANEIGGCVASMQMGRGGDSAPTGTFWGCTYTLRGPVDRQPGALMAYTAVVQNYFDGSGSRSPNFGYAAVTRPGIGDGADYYVPDPIRFSPTYPVDFGFVVCGDSGPYPTGGGIGYRVAFQAGRGASPWAQPIEEWRSKIGTGVSVSDWVQHGVHVTPPHAEAEPGAAHLRLDRREGQTGNLVECRSEDASTVLAAVRPDGRLKVAGGIASDDAVTRLQLDDEATNRGRGDGILDTRIEALESPPEPWRSAGRAGEPALENGWRPNPSTGHVRFYRHGHRTYLEAQLSGGDARSVAFVLPARYRPADLAVAVASASDGSDLRPALARVHPDGAVEIDYPAGHPDVTASISWRVD